MFKICSLALLCGIALVTLVFAQAQAETLRTVRLVIGTDEVLIELLDNPAANALVAQLPLTLPFRDYAGTEKIATLPTRLQAAGTPSGRETPVDFAYFVPWGNLALFYNGLGDNSQILALGHIRAGKAVLARQQENFTARMELVN